MNLEVSVQEVRKYLLKFFPSLQKYPNHYLPLVFEQYNVETEHLAYLCPLCLQNCIYVEGTKIRCSASFSLDHYPPQNVGGKNEMLVCKKCNNEAGHAYESSFKEIVIKEAYNRKVPNAQVCVRAELENVKGWIHANVSIGEDHSTGVAINKKQGHRIPKLTEDQQTTNNNGKGFKMNVRFNQVDDIKATKAILKTAYLYCFDYWGYDFAFSFAGNLIRDVLNDKTSYPVPVAKKWIDNILPEKKEFTIITGLVYLKEPADMLSLFVNVPAKIEEGNYDCVVPVLIPNPDDRDFSEMKRIQQFLDAGDLRHVGMAPVPFDFSLAYPESYAKTWEELKKLTP